MAELARPEDSAEIRLYGLLVEVWAYLEMAWKGSRCTCAKGYYAPEVVRRMLHHWLELTVAVEGVSAGGASQIGGNTSPDARHRLVAIKADLECGADKALINGRYLMWDATLRIYRRQGRSSFLWARRRELARWNQAVGEVTPSPEPRWSAEADEICYQRIATKLGWEPHDVCEDVA